MALKSFTFGTHPFSKTYEIVHIHTLQCTDMEGGNNKFFNMELQKGDDGKYRIYTVYGRTGANHAAKEERMPYPHEAESEYHELLQSKLKKRSGKPPYREVKVATVKHGSEVAKSQILSQDVAIKLDTTASQKSFVTDSRLAALIERLYVEAGQGCRSQLHGSLKTTVENPLGTLTLSQINTGKQILAEINKFLSANPAEINQIHSTIVGLSNEFYSQIPQQIPLRPRDEHGRTVWMKEYCLNRPKILDEKYDLLDLLGKVEDMKGGFESKDIDNKYKQIGCDIKVASAENFTYAKNYLEGSQSKHHSWRLKVKYVWEICSHIQKNHTVHMETIGNVKQLFHGTGPQNVLGICRKGLIMRNPGQYITSLMFGNGLYFADVSTKSSQYATGYGAYGQDYHTWFMYIADVALGKIKEYTSSQTRLIAAPPGYNSVLGKEGVSLRHNEYIVYNVKQNILRLLVEFAQG